MDMEAARIHALPDEGFYISDFITADEEDLLLQKVSEYNTSVKQNTCANMTIFLLILDYFCAPSSLDSSVASSSPNVSFSSDEIELPFRFSVALVACIALCPSTV